MIGPAQDSDGNEQDRSDQVEKLAHGGEIREGGKAMAGSGAKIRQRENTGRTKTCGASL
jgi:hypothetical protein